VYRIPSATLNSVGARSGPNTALAGKFICGRPNASHIAAEGRLLLGPRQEVVAAVNRSRGAAAFPAQPELELSVCSLYGFSHGFSVVRAPTEFGMVDHLPYPSGYWIGVD
jgi:hypothetical protein